MNAIGLIRSGWWVLVAAVAVFVLFVFGFFHLYISSSRAGVADQISLEPCSVERGNLVHAMARDRLRALFRPETMTPGEVDEHNENERGKLLVSSDRVVGVEIGGEARAYPLRLLRWHESVNDIVGGRAIAVTYSPLSGSIAVWDREVGYREVTLAISGWLYNSNTLLYDRQHPDKKSSLWHQLTGEAISGPEMGSRLTALPTSLQTWATWRAAHPDTTVMAPHEASKRLYKRDPYHSYRGSDLLRFPVEPLPPDGMLDLKDLVAVITHSDQDFVFALPYLEYAVGKSAGAWAALLGEVVFLIEFDAAAGTVSVEARDPAVPEPPVRMAYWFEWYALHPNAVPLP